MVLFFLVVLLLLGFLISKNSQAAAQNPAALTPLGRWAANQRVNPYCAERYTDFSGSTKAYFQEKAGCELNEVNLLNEFDQTVAAMPLLDIQRKELIANVCARCSGSQG